MRRKTFAATARDAHLAPAQMLQSLETLVRPGAGFGTESLQKGYRNQITAQSTSSEWRSNY